MEESEKQVSDERVPLECEVRCCYTCKYWQGDKVKVFKSMAKNPVCMDLFKGWPEIGICAISYEWLNQGFYKADNTLNVNANFGCPYWGA